MKIQEVVTDFICCELLSNNKARMPSPEEPLVGPVIDSIGLHQLVSFLESQFGIEVGDLEIVPENFETLSKLVSYVERKRGA